MMMASITDVESPRERSSRSSSPRVGLSAEQTPASSAMSYDNSKPRPSGMSAETIRMAVLMTLVFQNSAEAIFMRCSFKPREDVAEEDGAETPQPASSTAVVMAEVVKLVCSFLLQRMNDGSFRQVGSTLHQDVWLRPLDVLKMAVPSCLYVVQNNLKYVAISNLEGPTFQLLYQLKILSTAIFSVVMLNRVLLCRQWLALAMLALGVGLVQISGQSSQEADETAASAGSDDVHDDESAVLGFVAVVLACCTSGFAGVYFEKVLKGTSTSLWVRNMQLSMFGIISGVVAVWTKDGKAVLEHGFFYGYNFSVWMAILLNSLGGLVVAMVVKYADNVIKGFATSMSIVLTALVSFVLFDFSITALFVCGAYLVLQATFLFSSPRKTSTESKDEAVPGSAGKKDDEVELSARQPLMKSELALQPSESDRISLA